jgi:hypothetical protein
MSIVFGAFAVALLVAGALDARKYPFMATPIEFWLIFAAATAFCAGFTGAFRESWRHLLRGRIEADRDGLRYDDGTGLIEILWSDLRMIEVRSIQLGDEKNRDQLVLVGIEHVIVLDARLRQFDDVKRQAIAYAPDSAVVLPSSENS